jgi:rubredoxin
MLLGVQLFGQNVPPVAVFLIVAVLVIGYFAVSKGMPHRTGFSGSGRMYRCEQCGYDFQFERVENFADGTQHRFMDDRCPHCGWDQSREDPNAGHDNRGWR